MTVYVRVSFFLSINPFIFFILAHVFTQHEYVIYSNRTISFFCRLSSFDDCWNISFESIKTLLVQFVSSWREPVILWYKMFFIKNTYLICETTHASKGFFTFQSFLKSPAVPLENTFSSEVERILKTAITLRHASS